MNTTTLILSLNGLKREVKCSKVNFGSLGENCFKKNRQQGNDILRRKGNWVGHILRINCLLHDAIEGQMTEMKQFGRRKTQLLDDLRNRRYWELKVILI